MEKIIEYKSVAIAKMFLLLSKKKKKAMPFPNPRKACSVLIPNLLENSLVYFKLIIMK